MSVNYPNNNPYKIFTQQTGVYNPISSPALKPSSINSGAIASVQIGDVEQPESKKETEKMNPKKLIGIISASLGGTIILGLLGFAAVSKGFSGGFAKKLSKISTKARKAVYDLNAGTKNGENNLTAWQKIKLNVNKAIQHSADALQATSNFSAVKDSFTYHWMKKLGMGKISDGITNYFKKITLKTKNNAYKNAEYSTIDFCNYLKSLAKAQKDPAKAKSLEQKAEKIMQEYMAGFSAEKHIARSKQTWDDLAGLHDEVYDKLYGGKGGLFGNLRKYKTYITTDIIEKDRKALFKNVKQAKAAISNDMTDVNYSMKKALYDLEAGIDSSNQKAVELVKDIGAKLSESKALSGETELVKRNELFAKIKQNLDELSKIAKKDTKNKEAAEALEEKIARMKELTEPDAFKKGLAQEALTEIKLLYKDGRNSAEYKKAKAFMEKMNKNMNKAISSENQVYEKLAELRVGSAPTDVVGILGPAALAALVVANSKDRDERISRTLTGGVPIIGGIGMSYYGTLRGWTGAKNLILGLVTGWVLNIIGEQTDSYVKNYRVEQQKLKTAFESWTKLQKKQDTPSASTAIKA